MNNSNCMIVCELINYINLYYAFNHLYTIDRGHIKTQLSKFCVSKMSRTQILLKLVSLIHPNRSVFCPLKPNHHFTCLFSHGKDQKCLSFDCYLWQAFSEGVLLRQCRCNAPILHSHVQGTNVAQFTTALHLRCKWFGSYFPTPSPKPAACQPDQVPVFFPWLLREFPLFFPKIILSLYPTLPNCQGKKLKHWSYDSLAHLQTSFAAWLWKNRTGKCPSFVQMNSWISLAWVATFGRRWKQRISNAYIQKWLELPCYQHKGSSWKI